MYLECETSPLAAGLPAPSTLLRWSRPCIAARLLAKLLTSFHRALAFVSDGGMATTPLPFFADAQVVENGQNKYRYDEGWLWRRMH